MDKVNKISLYMVYSPAMTGKKQDKLPSVSAKEDTDKSEETLDYLASNPITKSNMAKVQTEVNDTDDDDDIFDSYDEPEEEKISLEEFEEILKSKHVISDKRLVNIAANLAKNNQLTQNYLNLVEEVNLAINGIEDDKVKNYIDKRLSQCREKDLSDEEESRLSIQEIDQYYKTRPVRVLFDALNVADAYNTLTGKYSRINKYRAIFIDDFDVEKTDTWEFIRQIEEKSPEVARIFIKQIANKKDRKMTPAEALCRQIFKSMNFSDDFIDAVKTEALKELCLYDLDEKIDEYLYNEYYLKSLDIDDEIKERCLKIDEKYGTKIFFSSQCSVDEDAEESTCAIEEELECWEKASEGKARLPVILDLNKTQKEFLGHTSGVSNLFSGKIVLDGGDLDSVTQTLRHEIMHLNKDFSYDHSQEGWFQRMTNDALKRAELIKEIMPQKTVIRKGKEISFPDFKNCKFREEFLNAGIAPEHILYAYTDSDEFIAVAAEGDMSRYSDKMKEVLKLFGMPEFVFNLKQTNYDTFLNIKKLEIVKEQNPEMTDFSEICEKISELKLSNDEIDTFIDEFFNQ